MKIEKEKVMSANKYYLSLGIICITLLISMLIIDFTSQNKEGESALIIGSIIFGLMAFVWIISYIKRDEFYIYSIKKEGIVNFDEIDKNLKQVMDINDRLYFIEEKDSFLYSQFELLNSIK